MCLRGMNYVSLLVVVMVVWVLKGCSEQPPTVSNENRPNIVFIVIDDLNDWVGTFGDPQAITPNIDRLAESGVLFERAYCAAPMCNASRASVMSGMYPYTTGIYDSEPLLYNRPDLVTMPAYFRRNGYSVHGGGKIFHHAAGNIDPSGFDEYYHWKQGAAARAGEMDYLANYKDLLGAGNERLAFSETSKEINNIYFDYHAFDDELEARVADSMVTGWAVDFLNREHDKPFLLAVGLYSPHKPNYAPEHYYDLYPADQITLPPVKDNDLEDVPAKARHLRLLRAKGLFNTVVKNDEWGGYVRGYLASISYADAQIGRVLDALQSSSHYNNTVVILWSDNGYHQGEKMHFGKKTLWERATHVPMIIAGPGVKRGGRCGTPVSLVDLYPTLIDLCGLPARDVLEGESLLSYLQDPSRNDDRHIVTTWHHPFDNPRKRPSISVRSRRWRYSRYTGGGEELFDEERDPNEWYNLAEDPDYTQVIAGMKAYLPKEVAKSATQKEDLELVIQGDTFFWVLRSEVKQGAVDSE